MTPDRTTPPPDPAEQGGDPPCWAHVVDGDPASPTSDDLARLIGDLADAVVISDRDGLITFWNRAAEQLFGWRADEVLGGSLDVIIPERFRARHWAGYQRVIATGHTDYGAKLLEVPTTHRDGTPMSLAFTVTLLTDPRFRGCTGVAAVLRDDTAAWQSRGARRAELTEVRAARPS